MYPRYNTPGKKTNKLKYVLLGFIGLIVLFGILEATNVTHVLHKKPVPVTASSYTKGEGSNSASATADKGTVKNNTNSSATAGQPGDDKSATGGGNSAALLTPTGDFVSNHHPNLSGKPAPNSISSVCTTTPGASCTITFTKDGISKSLPSQVTDRGGSAYWSWKLQDIGLTAGSWNIKATASQDGKSLSATDAMQLVVAE